MLVFLRERSKVLPGVMRAVTFRNATDLLQKDLKKDSTSEEYKGAIDYIKTVLINTGGSVEDRLNMHITPVMGPEPTTYEIRQNLIIEDIIKGLNPTVNPKTGKMQSEWSVSVTNTGSFIFKHTPSEGVSMGQVVCHVVKTSAGGSKDDYTDMGVEIPAKIIKHYDKKHLSPETAAKLRNRHRIVSRASGISDNTVVKDPYLMMVKILENQTKILEHLAHEVRVR
jgi:hypothetical protein